MQAALAKAYGTDRMALTMSLTLGSRSPRRRWLLETLGFDVLVCPSEADERWPSGRPREAVSILARRKLDALTRAEASGVGLKSGDVIKLRRPIITADTVVFLDERPLNKPTNRDEARSHLRSLSGRSHRVMTAFCVAGTRGEVFERAVETEVIFRSLTEQAIEHYLDQGESMDKAGAYGIQGPGATLVDSIRGSFTNVIGLPLNELLECLEFLE